jgi:hypothetical protein
MWAGLAAGTISTGVFAVFAWYFITSSEKVRVTSGTDDSISRWWKEPDAAICCLLLVVAFVSFGLFGFFMGALRPPSTRLKNDRAA